MPASREPLTDRTNRTPPVPGTWAGLALALTCLVLAMDARAQAPTSRPAPDAPAMGDYRIVWERSVFLARSRREPAPAPAPPASQPAPPPHDPRTDWVVRGVLAADGRYVAYLENVAAGTRRTVRPGEAVEGLAVDEVILTGLRLGDGAEVQVGQTLAGTWPTGGAPSPMSGSAAPAPPGPAPTPEMQALLERLRQRRAQQTAQPR